MIFYVVDTTVNLPQMRSTADYNLLVNHLSNMSQRVYKQDKVQRQQLLEEIGYGPDDYNSTIFVRSMAEKFDMGVVRNNLKTRCDITTIVAFQKPEYGD